MVKSINKCRVCGNTKLERVLDLGEQMLTGVFPTSVDSVITKGPLRLVKCIGDEDVCGLLQLEHSYELSEMYGLNYGYRSGLNASMVRHLNEKVKKISQQIELKEQDLVIDIGSNDSTTLQAYPDIGLTLLGVDPTGVKFRKYYPEHIKLIPDFFSSSLIKEKYKDKKARVITSFSMFYDLEEPLKFMKEIYEILEDDGLWVFEQSYMPTMLKMNSYDTVCHEHLEYYGLSQIKWMADKVGFHVQDVEFNDVNGGSFSVTVSKNSNNNINQDKIQQIITKERELGLNGLRPYNEFAENVVKTKLDMLEFLSESKNQGKTVCALGASTKGNVLLQYCGVTSEDIKFVGEVNEEKYGCFTPGSNIPIIPEDELLAKKPDYLVVLPWHFKQHFIKSEKYKGTQLVFPLPSLTYVSM